MDFLTAYQGIGAIIAEPHAGKTQFAISYCVAACTGLPFLHFVSSPAKRVCYFDAEMPWINFRMSLAQAINALSADEKIVAEMLLYRSIRDEGHEELIDISKQKFQDDFETSIKESGAEIIIFDDLINLILGFRNSARYEWPVIWDWMRKLEREYGASIVIVHHDNDKGDGAGTKDIRTQCSTVLFLQDPRSKFVKGDWAKGADL